MKKTFVFITILFACAHCFAQRFSITHAMCEHRVEPLSIQTQTPVFSWQLQSRKRNILQTAYRIVVAQTRQEIENNVNLIWDSKQVLSDNCTQVFYNGNALKAGQAYVWQVHVVNSAGEHAKSIIANFSTGLYNKADWRNAKWIGYGEMNDTLRTVPGVNNTDTKRKLGATKLKDRAVVPLFRKDFKTTAQVASAKLFVSAVGQYELSLNGQKIGDRFLAPGWTDFDDRVFYNVFDVTKNIHSGLNTVGLWAGNGFAFINRERYIKFAIAYSYPKVLCKLVLTYTNGSTDEIVTDATWQTAPSPIEFTSLYGGEDYNANLEQAGWNTPRHSSAGWRNAVVVQAPKGSLEAEMDNPVAVKSIFIHKAISKPDSATYVYDFGQNLSGIIELKVQGKKGDTVKLWPGELLHADGFINQDATGKPYYYMYILKGGAVETWRPRFTYTGFRYVQVQGAVPFGFSSNLSLPKIIQLTSLHTANTSASSGNFTCSNTLFNRINSLITWAINSNLQSVVTDCPHREKLGWLEQDYLMGSSIQANYDVYLLYKKLVRDMQDAQTSEGLVPDIAPEFDRFDDNGFGFRDSPEWGSASIVVPWLIYKWYGDTTILHEAYPMMEKYFNYLQSRSVNNILDYGLGDWFDYGPNPPGVAQLTPRALTATATYFYDAQLLQNISQILGKTKNAAHYAYKATNISRAFNDSFYNAKTKVYATGSQTAMAMPLVLGLVNSDDRTAVLHNLIDSIKANDYKLTAGDIGFHYLIEALMQGDKAQVIFDMNFRDDVPGYGYQLKKGATALTESWPALPSVSNNHLMLGHIMQWFYEGLAGVAQTSSSVGYKHILIHPQPVGNINFAKANHESLYGNITTAWRKTSNRFYLDVTIPANTTATIILPAQQNSRITESSREIIFGTRLGEAVFLNGSAQVEIGSGTYHFIVQ